MAKLLWSVVATVDALAGFALTIGAVQEAYAWRWVAMLATFAAMILVAAANISAAMLGWRWRARSGAPADRPFPSRASPRRS